MRGKAGANVMPGPSKVVPLRELRFKPANSNDAARADLSHSFTQVPKCSFAKDDGISQYLASETGMEPAPNSPLDHVVLHENVPDISIDDVATGGKFNFKLLRDGFSAAVLIHVVAAASLFFVMVPDMEAPTELEGVTVVSVVVDGNEEAAVQSGDVERIEEPAEKSIEKPVDKPVETVKIPVPVQARTEEILKDVPMPQLGALVPEILTAKQPAEPKVEAALKIKPEEKPVEQPIKEMTAAVPERKIEPEIKPEPVLPIPQQQDVKRAEEEPKPEPKKEEPKPEPKKEEPKKKPEKKEPKREKVKGNKGAQENNSRRGKEGAKSKKASANDTSSGDSSQREIGNSSRSNYEGLVQKKIQRAKSRVRARGKGTVVVTFTVVANGGVSGLRVSRSSGEDKLDQAALKMINIAAPFPAIPEEVGRKGWRMTIPIEFR